ncbi:MULTISPECIES: rhomboid family intramembrane serine protease [Haematobacter]|nr:MULTISPECIES: rhomboid family intramembrane serine protease [Haematobacter]
MRPDKPLPARQRPRFPRREGILTDRMRAMPVVLVLFVACLIPELILSGADYGLWGDPGWRLWAWQHGGFWTGLLGNWRPNYAAQPWLMFLTYGFLHGGVIHFGVNMLTLFSLAPPLVERMGQGRFLLLYMASMIGGGLGFALLSQSPQPMVGASGALFGLAGAVMALSWQYLRARGESLRPVIRSLLWLAGLNLVLWWAMSGMLAWETHLGGFVVGWLMGLWLVRDGR